MRWHFRRIWWVEKFTRIKNSLSKRLVSQTPPKQKVLERMSCRVWFKASSALLCAIVHSSHILQDWRTFAFPVPLEMLHIKLSQCVKFGGNWNAKLAVCPPLPRWSVGLQRDVWSILVFELLMLSEAYSPNGCHFPRD